MSTYRWQQKYIQRKTGMMGTSGRGRQGDIGCAVRCGGGKGMR